MPLFLSPDEVVGFKIMVALIKATRSVEHEIVHKFCQRKGITLDELLDTPGKNGTIRELIESSLKAMQAVEGDDQVARLKRTGLVDVSSEATYH